MKISVIVPVYNTEDYLEKCINSILLQTLSDMEIILVDDGSSDKSGLICDEFAEKNSNIKVIHTPNCGQSNARNIGLKEAEGEYIGFVDSDDYIEQNMYEILFNMAQKNDSDIVFGNYDEVSVSGKTVYTGGGVSLYRF